MNMRLKKFEKEKKEHMISVRTQDSCYSFVKERADLEGISVSTSFRRLFYDAYADCIENKRTSRNRNNFYVECGEIKVIYNS